MDEKSFDEERIAQGYAKDRPYLHGQVIDCIKEYLYNKEKLQITQRFHHGLDVGCGAGLSTKALKNICDKVTGTDISEEMIKISKALYRNQRFQFQKNKAEDCFAAENTFDIVSAAGVVNWVDREAFLTSLRYMMKEKGFLIIYDFWISDQMKDCASYTDWWRKEYLVEFPKPPRKEDTWQEGDMAPFDFHKKEQLTYELTYSFTMESFIRFMMIQSNVNIQITQGKKTSEDVYRWFQKTLTPVWKNQEHTLIFQGYAWILQLEKAL